MKRIAHFIPLLFKLPTSIRSQVVSFFAKKIVGAKQLDHEVIWTSFFYFTFERAVKITERERDYLVEFSENSNHLGVFIRKGKSSDIFVFFQVFISREYQPLLDFLQARQWRPCSFIDGGANVGFFSLLLAFTFSQAKITSVEPELSNVLQLRENLSFNTLLDRVKIIEAALWTSWKRLLIQNSNVKEWAFSVAETEANGNCEAFSLADVMRLTSMNQIDLLKLDIERTEGALFANTDFQNFLHKVVVIAMEIHDHLVDRKKIHNVLREQSFEFFEKGELTVAWNKRLL